MEKDLFLVISWSKRIYTLCCCDVYVMITHTSKNNSVKWIGFLLVLMRMVMKN